MMEADLTQYWKGVDSSTVNSTRGEIWSDQ